MTDPTIICPSCKTEIRLTESLAAPLVAATRNEFEQRLAQQNDEIAKREQGMREKEKQIVEARRNLDAQIAGQVATQLKAERARVVAEESQKARLASAVELENKVHELAVLQEVLEINNEKLAEAQKAQAELIKKQRELDDARRELDYRRKTRAGWPGRSARAGQTGSRRRTQAQGDGERPDHRVHAAEDRRTQAEGRSGFAAIARRGAGAGA